MLYIIPLQHILKFCVSVRSHLGLKANLDFVAFFVQWYDEDLSCMKLSLKDSEVTVAWFTMRSDILKIPIKGEIVFSQNSA